MHITDYFSGKMTVWCLTALLTASCSQQARDRQIKADITGKAKEDVNFAGVRFLVEHDKVILFGNCATPESMDMVLKQLKTIHVIKSIDNRLRIAPVTMGTDFTLKQQVDSVLASYPTVSANLSNNALVLIGRIESKDMKKLQKSVEKLNTGRLTLSRLKISE
jgi:6-phosphofructokinase